mgnify:CR=1 FL=1
MKKIPIIKSRRLRSTPYTDRIESNGVSGYTVYNHMLLPVSFGSIESDYKHLKKFVQVWDVAAERQVEISGKDSAKLVQLMTCRDLSKSKIGKCYYAPLIDDQGCLVNDPIINKLAEDNANKPGDGAASFVVSNVVSRRGSEVVTEICVDLGSSVGAASQAGTANAIIGVSSSSGTHSPAFLTTLTPAVNGYIVGAEMVCTELPQGGTADIDLRIGTTLTTGYSGSVAGGTPATLIAPAGAWTLGAWDSYAASLGGKHDIGAEDYGVYLVTGEATDGADALAYTHGKFSIKLIGYLACDDK